MKASRAKLLVKTRIAVQTIFLLLFLFFFFKLLSGDVFFLKAFQYFFYWDPLLFFVVLILARSLFAFFVIGLLLFIMSFLLGRFFCGWLCPFGALQQFISYIFRKKNGKDFEKHKSFFRLKYLLLFGLFAGLLTGLNLTGWFDPFGFFSRALAVFMLPFFNNALLQINAWGQKLPFLDGIFARSFQVLKSNSIITDQLFFSGYLLIALIFLVLIVLTARKRRFYCNYLCPLGAIYGMAARVALFKFTLNEKCIKCNRCNLNCPYGLGPFQDYRPSECLTCFNCVRDCPVEAIDFKFSLKVSRHEQLPSRRAFVAALAGGFFVGTLSTLKTSKKERFRSFLRPPGAKSEQEFLKLCERCATCMRSCPTNALQPALFQAGLEGLWTPLFVPTIGYCEYECNRCTQSCPTGAIRPLTLKEKKEFKIGVAVVDKNLCYTYADGYDCAVCQEHCPVPEKAIKFKEAEVINYRGKKVKVNQIYINTLLCIGCGICENVCPRTDSPAILVKAEQESRQEY